MLLTPLFGLGQIDYCDLDFNSPDSNQWICLNQNENGDCVEFSDQKIQQLLPGFSENDVLGVFYNSNTGLDFGYKINVSFWNTDIYFFCNSIT